MRKVASFVLLALAAGLLSGCMLCWDDPFHPQAEVTPLTYPYRVR